MMINNKFILIYMKSCEHLNGKSWSAILVILLKKLFFTVKDDVKVDPVKKKSVLLGSDKMTGVVWM